MSSAVSSLLVRWVVHYYQLLSGGSSFLFAYWHVGRSSSHLLSGGSSYLPTYCQVARHFFSLIVRWVVLSSLDFSVGRPFFLEIFRCIVRDCQVNCPCFQGLSVGQSFFLIELLRGFFFLLRDLIYFIINFCDILNVLSRKCNKSCHYVPRQGFFK